MYKYTAMNCFSELTIDRIIILSSLFNLTQLSHAIQMYFVRMNDAHARANTHTNTQSKLVYCKAIIWYIVRVIAVIDCREGSWVCTLYAIFYCI